MEQLNNLEIQALNEALDDEYHSWSTYDQVIADFGEQRPFTNIRDAEARHIGALRVLYERYQVPFPPNAWLGKVERYETLQAACHAAAAAEIANAALYDRLFAAVAARDDITEVFHRLLEASQDRHLPAFRRCEQRGAGGGRGAGTDPGSGPGSGQRRRRRRGGRGDEASDSPRCGNGGGSRSGQD